MHCDQLAEREVDDVRERKTAEKDAALLSLNAGICIQNSPVAVGPLGDSVKKKGEGCQRQMHHNFKWFDHLGASMYVTRVPSSLAQAHVKNINFSKFQLLYIGFSRPMSSSLLVCGLSRMPSIDVHEVRAPVRLIPEAQARLRQSSLESNYALRMLLISSPGDF